MSLFYEDYIWKNGLPYGTRPLQENVKKEISFKISSDPYHKRIAIEKYINNEFSNIVYDSAFLDFRHLKLGEQLAWQKTPVNESENEAVCHIRNQDDRLVLIEKYQFKKNLCCECKAFSSFGTLISVQKISYKFLGDDFDGVTLYDSEGRKVMEKIYLFDEIRKEFTQLINEEWCIQAVP